LRFGIASIRARVYSALKPPGTGPRPVAPGDGGIIIATSDPAPADSETLLACSEDQEPAVYRRRNGIFGRRDSLVVDREPSLRDGPARLSVGGVQTGGYREPKRAALEILGAEIEMVERGVELIEQSRVSQWLTREGRLADPNGPLRFLLAVYAGRNVEGESALGRTGFRVGYLLGFQLLDPPALQ